MKTVEEEVDYIMNAPNFTIKHCGTTYKFGKHGFTYRWSEVYQYWVKSEVTSDILRKPIRSRIIKEHKELDEASN